MLRIIVIIQKKKEEIVDKEIHFYLMKIKLRKERLKGKTKDMNLLIL